MIMEYRMACFCLRCACDSFSIYALLAPAGAPSHGRSSSAYRRVRSNPHTTDGRKKYSKYILIELMVVR